MLPRKVQLSLPTGPLRRGDVSWQSQAMLPHPLAIHLSWDSLMKLQYAKTGEASVHARLCACQVPVFELRVASRYSSLHLSCISSLHTTTHTSKAFFPETRSYRPYNPLAFSTHINNFISFPRIESSPPFPFPTISIFPSLPS